MGSIYWLICIISTLSCVEAVVRLKVCNSGTGNRRKFCYYGAEVYLSGMNQAWSSYHNYAKDFGNYRYDTNSRVILEDVLNRISLNGGNSIRIFVHTDSSFTPWFADDGSVRGADYSSNHIIQEMKEYLCAARRKGIIVFFVLWNGASWSLDWGQQLNGLITDDDKLQSYIDHALVPIVNALKGYSSLGGYDIMNEPEGILINGVHNYYDCFNTFRLRFSGAGWATNNTFPHLFWMQRLQQFVNWQANAIKLNDPKSLVTVGSWSEKTQFNGGPADTFNYFSDYCLRLAGGRYHGILDFHQIHTYTHGGSYSSHSPMNVAVGAGHFNLNKPLVIGEFSEAGGDRPINQLVQHAFYNGYAGAWSWHAAAIGDNTDTFDRQAYGLRILRCRPEVNFSLRISIFITCPARIQEERTELQSLSGITQLQLILGRPRSCVRRPFVIINRFPSILD